VKNYKEVKKSVKYPLYMEMGMQNYKTCQCFTCLKTNKKMKDDMA